MEERPGRMLRSMTSRELHSRGTQSSVMRLISRVYGLPYLVVIRKERLSSLSISWIQSGPRLILRHSTAYFLSLRLTGGGLWRERRHDSLTRVCSYIASSICILNASGLWLASNTLEFRPYQIIKDTLHFIFRIRISFISHT